LSRFWNKRNLALLILLAVGLGLRLWGVGQGLPSSYYPDERHFINRAMSFGTGDFNPHWFHKPALYMYLLFLEYGLFFLIGKAVGLFATLHDFARLYINDLSSFLLIGRITTALLGTATIGLLYRLGLRMYGHRVATIAAFFLTFTFAHVRSSQWVKADVPMAFFALASFFYLYRILETGSWRSYVLAGLFAGLGMATKYTPVVLVIPLCFAHLGFLRSSRPFPWRRLVDGRLLLALFSLGVGFFIGSPYNILDSYWWKSNLSMWFQSPESGPVTTGVGLGERLVRIFCSPMMHFFKVILRPDSLGVILAVLGLMGLLFLLWRGHRGDRLTILTVFSIVYVSYFLFGSYAEARHYNILYPFLSLGSAALAMHLVERVVPGSSERSFRWRGALAAALAILVVLPSADRIYGYNRLISRKDTRTVAKEWIETNIPAGTKILVDDYCVPLKMSANRVRELLDRAEGEEENGPFTAHAAVYYRYYRETVQEPTYYLLEISHPWWMENEQANGTFPLDSQYDRDMGNPLKVWGVTSVETYRAQGYRYLVTTDEITGKYRPGGRSADFFSFVRFYQEVERKGSLVYRFDPGTLKRPGPNVFIYRLSPDD